MGDAIGVNRGGGWDTELLLMIDDEGDFFFLSSTHRAYDWRSQVRVGGDLGVRISQRGWITTHG